MVTERDHEVASETEASERPVREQLKKAAISEASAANANTATDNAIVKAVDVEEDVDENGERTEEIESRGRPQKKRSFEDVGRDENQGSENSESSHHRTRKRSRDSTAEEQELNDGQRKSGERSREKSEGELPSASNGQPKPPASVRPRTPEQTGDKRSEAAVEEMTSPKSKRSRLHASTEENDEDGTERASSEAARNTETAHTPKDSSEGKTTAKIPPTSGFANASAASPFASLGGSKSPSSEPAQTSGGAFAASGFSALCGSSGSGFGTIGKSSGGPGAGGGFSSGTKSPSLASDPKGANKDIGGSRPTSSSMFGGSLGQQSAFTASTTGASAFGLSTSGFGGFGQKSAFGSSGLTQGFGGLGGGSLNSFSSGKPSTTFASSSKPMKAFGAPAEEDDAGEDDGEGEDDSGFKSPLSQESDQQDERFYEQDLETGEEDEATEYSCRAKLYNFATIAEGKKEWKERGLGVVRLNVKKAGSEDEEAKPTARLLMRAEGSHRVILNTAVKKEIKFGTPNGEAPQGGYVYFMGAVDGKTGLELLQLKVS